MNNNGLPPGFPWTELWNAVDGTVRGTMPAQPGSSSQARNTQNPSTTRSEDPYGPYRDMFNPFGFPTWMNMPVHGGPPHRGPGRGRGPPPPPPSGHQGPTPPEHEGPHPPPPGHHGPPPPGHHGPPPPGHHGPPPPPRGSSPPPPFHDSPPDPPSRAPTPPTPATPPEELPEYPGFAHDGPPHHGRHGRRHHDHRHRHDHGKGKGPEGHHNPDDKHDSDPFENHWFPWSGPQHGRRGGPPHCRRRGRHGPGPRGGPWQQPGVPNWADMFSNPAFAPKLDALREMFGSFAPPAPPEGQDGTFVPDIDVFDLPTQIQIHVSLPGAKKGDVDVTYDAAGHSVMISGVVGRPERVDEEMLGGLVEGGRKVGFFERKVRLPGKEGVVVTEEIKARLEEGVLRVVVPKVLEEEGWEEVRKVQIE